MDEFNTLEKVKKLFIEKGLGGDNDIYLALLKDTRKYTGMVKGMEYPYMGLLLDISDNGVGFYHLKQEKFSLKVSFEKLVVDKDSFTFIDKSNISCIEVKKFALLDKKRRELVIKTNDKKAHYVYGAVEDNQLPYHNENMSRLIEKYSVR